jgi:hypothetical protein
VSATLGFENGINLGKAGMPFSCSGYPVLGRLWQLLVPCNQRLAAWDGTHNAEVEVRVPLSPPKSMGLIRAHR